MFAGVLTGRIGAYSCRLRLKTDHGVPDGSRDKMVTLYLG